MVKLKAAVSHHERELDELRNDPELAIAYLKLALESLEDPEQVGAAMLALRTVTEACGGVGSLAATTGLSREALYRTLSENGNPTLKTLVAILGPMGLRLTVERVR